MAVTLRNRVSFSTLLVGTQMPDSPPQQENIKMNKHVYKISLLENKTFTYLGLRALFSLGNVWDVVMICLNNVSLALMMVWDAYSLQLTETDEENTGFERGFGERTHR